MQRCCCNCCQNSVQKRYVRLLLHRQAAYGRNLVGAQACEHVRLGQHSVIVRMVSHNQCSAIATCHFPFSLQSHAGSLTAVQHQCLLYCSTHTQQLADTPDTHQVCRSPGNAAGGHMCIEQRSGPQPWALPAATSGITSYFDDCLNTSRCMLLQNVKTMPCIFSCHQLNASMVSALK